MKNTEEEWIPVNEKLPKDQQIVKLKGKFTKDSYGFFKRVTEKSCYSFPYFFQVFGITHWMPVEKSLLEVLEILTEETQEK